MKKRFIILFSFLVVLTFSFQSIAQFTEEELAERAKWEEFLSTAKIIDQDQPWSAREAVTRPWRLTLEKDGEKAQAIWKDPLGRQKGFYESWKWEIAAYRLDKYLGLNMVPPTVEKRFREERGSCQKMVDYWISLKEKYDKKIKILNIKIYYWNRALYLQRAFDNLIANEDRHQNQYLITEDWRMILIDHSRSFRTSRKFTKKLIYDEKYKEGPRLMKQLPRAFVEKLKSLNFQVIKDIVEDYLTDKEINAVLTRKDLIIDWINKRIKKLGEKEVLYD
jgi:hypothetical protein